jgi:hypothetical protein
VDPHLADAAHTHTPIELRGGVTHVKHAYGRDQVEAEDRDDYANRSLHASNLPITGGVKPHGTVIVPLATLHHADGAPGADTAYGATLSGETARRLLCDADISRIITNPAGETLDAGRATRTFTAAMTRAIVARDRHSLPTTAKRSTAAPRIIRRSSAARSRSASAVDASRHHDRVHVHHHAIIKTAGRYTVDLRPDSDPTHSNAQRAGP